MVDRISFTLHAQGNIKAIFQRLNGFTMGDILDTFDALLKEKSFYPNVSTYRSELDSAGIFVKRMEVAMAAVMRKGSGNFSIDQFTTDYAHMLTLLPEDQRSEITKYLTGAKGDASLPDSKLVAQYLEYANSAVFRTRNLLHRGALNRLSDWPSGGPIATVVAREKGGDDKYMHAAKQAEIAISAAGGNCEEFSATAYIVLKKMGVTPIHWVKLVSGDHAFVLIGKGPWGMLDSKDLKVWGDNVVVCDAWDKASYIASSIPTRLPSYEVPFRAMIQESSL